MEGAPERIGPYEIRGELGRGGMGVVYRAYRADLNREYAVKCILSGAAGGSSTEGADTELRRFQREAEAVARLGKHPNVVAVHDVGVDAGRHYLVMDLVDGRSLDRVVAEEPLPPTRAATIAMGIARGLAHAHGHGILHRDLKPANVLLGPDDVPQVTDFGLARDVRGGSELTISGSIIGTPEYMAPEQARGAEHTTERSEVYAIGATLYQMLTGRPPHIGNAAVEVLASLATGEPTPIRVLAAQTPPDLVAVINQALAREPGDRYPTAAAMAEDLQRFVQGLGVLARPVSRVVRLIRWTRRHPSLAGASAALVVALGVAWWAYNSMQAAEEERDASERIAQDTEARRREAEAEARRAARETAEVQRRIELVEEPYRRAVELGLGADSRRARLELLNRALGHDPRWVPALIARAMTHAAGGNLGAAQADLDLAVAVAPNDVDAWMQLARFHRDRTGDNAQALASYERAAGLAPESSSGLVARAYLAGKRGDPKGALELVVAARAAGAPPSECQYLEGLHWLAMTDLPRAIGLFLEATREDPWLMQAYYRRSQAFEQLGRYDEAEAEIERALAANPEDYNGYYHRGRFRSRARRYDEAYADYTRVLQGRPDHPYALVNRANAARRIGRLEDALADLQRAEQLQPDLPQIPAARADVLVEMGRYPEALEWFGRAIAVAPGRATPYFNRGCLYMNLDQPALALPDFEQATRLEPSFARAWEYRGFAAQRLGKLPEADAHLQRARKLDPKAWTALNRHAEVLEALGQPEAALEAFRTCTELRPSFGAGWIGWSRCLQAAGRTDLAEGVLLKGLVEVTGTPEEPKLRAALASLRSR